MAIGAEVEPLVRRRLLPGLLDWLEREAFAIPFVAGLLVVLLRELPSLLTEDGWLTLVGGREIWERGLPSADTLATMTAGAPWVDQQWLAQAVAYGAYRLGGVELTLLAHVAIVSAAFAAAVVAARRRGASARRLGVVAALSLLVIAPSSPLRAQAFAYPLFVGLVWLLAAESRRPSRRVWLVLPLLAVWANVHGSVVLGAAIVLLAGVAHAVDRRRAGVRPAGWYRRSALLAGAPVLCLFASPYALSLGGYYRETIGNRAFTKFVPEWQPVSFPDDWPFFLLATATVWLLGRRGGMLTLFEKLVLGTMLVAGLLAARNVAWLGFAALVILPVTVEAVWPIKEGETRRRRLSIALALGSIGVAAVAFAATAARAPAAHEAAWPADRLADTVAAALRADPSARVMADTRFGDWLLWKRPELAGRLAFDIRFELLTGPQIEQLADYHSGFGERWKQVSDGYRLVVLDRRTDPGRERAFLAEPGARLLFQDDSASLIARRR